jgi:hypothetical protein
LDLENSRIVSSEVNYRESWLENVNRARKEVGKPADWLR